MKDQFKKFFLIGLIVLVLIFIGSYFGLLIRPVVDYPYRCTMSPDFYCVDSEISEHEIKFLLKNNAGEPLRILKAEINNSNGTYKCNLNFDSNNLDIGSSKIFSSENSCESGNFKFKTSKKMGKVYISILYSKIKSPEKEELAIGEFFGPVQ